MVIDLSTIILIIAIIGANLVVLVKIFYKDEDDDEKKETLKEFPAVSKSWEEPMGNNHEKILDNNKYDLDNEIAIKNTNLNNAKIAKDNTEISNKKELVTKKSEYDIEIAKDNLDESEDLNQPKLKKTPSNEDTEVVGVIIGNKAYELTLKDNIIFTYNNENYSSYVLEIKHNNVKVKYRYQEKWINFSDIKKIL
jgi:hypothetical protein